MSGNKNKGRSAPSATPWGDTPDDLLKPAQVLVRSAHRGAYAFRHERFAKDIDFFNAYTCTRCPWCAEAVVKNGFTAKGLQKYRCKTCGKISTPVTGTIFDDAKLPATAWADFIYQALSFQSTSAMVREDRHADTTTQHWLPKLFLFCLKYKMTLFFQAVCGLMKSIGQ